MQFERLKKKRILLLLLASILIGVSAGVTVSAAVVVLEKLLINEAKLGIALIWGGVAALAGVIFTVVPFYPTDRRLAKLCDERYVLDERVRTMVAFKNDKGEIHKYQRLDANSHLEEAIAAAPFRKRSLLVLLAPIIAVAVAVSAVLIPIRVDDAQPDGSDDPDFNLSSWQEQALIDLIETVNSSELQQAPKTETVAELESLLVTLRNVKKVGAMKSAVVSSITKINKYINDYNSYDAVGASMNKAINPAVIRLGAAVSSLRATAVSEEMDLLVASLTGESAYAQASSLSSSLKASLSASGADGSDKLVEALEDFAKALDAICDGEPLGEALLSAVNIAIGDAKGSVNAALLLQSGNEAVRNTTVRRLMQIFGIEESELPATERPGGGVLDGGKGGSDGDDDDRLNSGGLGSGDMIYGSDDTVYDPESGEYLTYGEVIDRYFAKVSEKFAYGAVPEELEQLVSEYFASLYNGDK